MLHYGPHEEIIGAIQRNGVGGIVPAVLFWFTIVGIWARCMWQRIKEFIKRRKP